MHHERWSRHRWPTHELVCIISSLLLDIRRCRLAGRNQFRSVSSSMFRIFFLNFYMISFLRWFFKKHQGRTAEMLFTENSKRVYHTYETSYIPIIYTSLKFTATNKQFNETIIFNAWIVCIPFFTSWRKKFSQEPDETEKTKSKRLKMWKDTLAKCFAGFSEHCKIVFKACWKCPEVFFFIAWNCSRWICFTE